MVKPPKSMQPEGIHTSMTTGRSHSNSRSGSGSGSNSSSSSHGGNDKNTNSNQKNPHRGMGNDSFRFYMARKIELQRTQFGNIQDHLPPTPPEPESKSKSSPESKSKSKSSPESKSKSPPTVHPHTTAPAETTTTTTTTNVPSTPRVRFHIDTSTTTTSSTAPSTTKSSLSSPSSHSKSGRTTMMMEDVIARLDRKHKRLSSRRRRHLHRSSTSSGSSYGHKRRKSLHDENDEDDDNKSPFVNVVGGTTTITATPISTTNTSANQPQQQQQQQQHAHTTTAPPPPPPPALALNPRRSHRRDLFFRGIVVLVNGYTNPDNETLQRMLHRHGGDMERYETIRVTHIIASQLSFAKAKIYKERKRGKPIPVVRPEWILQCIQQQTLIPHGPYILESLQEKGCKSLVTYFNPKPTTTNSTTTNSTTTTTKWTSPNTTLPTICTTPTTFTSYASTNNNNNNDNNTIPSSALASVSFSPLQQNHTSPTIMTTPTATTTPTSLYNNNDDDDSMINCQQPSSPEEDDDEDERQEDSPASAAAATTHSSWMYYTQQHQETTPMTGQADDDDDDSDDDISPSPRYYEARNHDDDDDHDDDNDDDDDNKSSLFHNTISKSLCLSSPLSSSFQNELNQEHSLPCHDKNTSISPIATATATEDRRVLLVPSSSSPSSSLPNARTTVPTTTTTTRLALHERDQPPLPNGRKNVAPVKSIAIDEWSIDSNNDNYDTNHDHNHDDNNHDNNHDDDDDNNERLETLHHDTSDMDHGSKDPSMASSSLHMMTSSNPVPDESKPRAITTGRTDSKYIHGKLRTTGTDPNFLDSFFSNSRLSFIGSYKQRTQSSSSSTTTIASSSSSSPLKSRQGPSKDMSLDTREKKQRQRFVFHCDMDCFFASVVLRKFPQYKSKPVAISHCGATKKKMNNNNKKAQHEDMHHDTTTTTDHHHESSSSPSSSSLHNHISKTSSSECATCNYEARKYGIRKGMFLGRARELCPELIVLPYDFDGYEEVSEQVSDILIQYANTYHGAVEQVSCDEAYMELYLSPPSLSSTAAVAAAGVNPQGNKNDVDHDGAFTTVHQMAHEIAERIRHEIVTATDCTATIGVGPNKLLAKLGTDKVKPNGCHVVSDYHDLLEPLRLRDLHGVGYRSEPKLKEAGLVTVKDVWDMGDDTAVAESALCRILGDKTGKKIMGFCRGEDDREVNASVERKTIGAECNYGVRFDGIYGVDYMVKGLAKEVEKRMTSVGVMGSKLTLKVKQRKTGAKPPPKFLGHGSCHNLSKSLDLPAPTRDAQIFARCGLQLFHELGVPKDDVRGMGIVLSKLDTGKQSKNHGSMRALKSWFQPRLDTVMDQKEEMEDGIISDNDDILFVEETNRKASTRGLITEANDTRPNITSVAQLPTESNEMDDIDDAIHDDIDDDIELPPQSQIAMSQVEALPTPLKRKVMARLERRQNFDLEVDVETPLYPPPHVEDKNMFDVHQWKQTSVKHMFKLARVKAGKETLSGTLGESVSLTQFECLPFEMQLQIANEGELSPPMKKASTRMDNTRNVASRVSVARRSLPAEQSHNVSSRIGESGSSTEPELVYIVDNDDNEEIEEPGVSQVILNDRRSFYLEYVAPLKQFLDDNTPHEDDAVQMVMKFLSTCAKEGQLQQVVQLLRSIKNRRDDWSGVSYDDLLNCVDSSIESETGCRLDRSWLEL